MTFLAPIAGLVAGGMAVGVLALLQILKLRRAPMRVSSVWLWEAAARDTQANVPWQRLRLSWLVLVQLLALLLLAAAIGRPVLTGSQTTAQRVIVLVDTSASMGARDSGVEGTRLERSLAQARDAIGELGRGSGKVSVALLEASGATRVVEPFTSSIRSIGRALDRVAQTEQAGDLPLSLDMAIAMLAGGSDSSLGTSASILVFSDGVSGASTIRPDALPAGVRLEHRRTTGVEERAPINVGIAAFHVSRQALDPAFVDCFAQLVNTGTDAVDIPVVIEIDGNPMRAKQIRIPGATTEDVGRLVYSERVRSPAGTVVRLRLKYGDALDADNSAQVVLASRHTARAMIVAPDDGVDPFLERAIEATGTRIVRIIDLDVYEQSWSFQPDVDIVVFDRTTPRAAPPLPTVSFGSTAGVAGVSLISGAHEGVSRLLSWRREHPVMSGVGMGAVLLESPAVFQWDVDEFGRSSIEVLARSVEGPTIVYVEEERFARVLVSVRLAETTWPVDVSFAVFVSNVIPVLTPGLSPEGYSISTNDTELVEAEPNAQRVRVMGPTEQEWPVSQGAQRVSIGPMSQAGVYAMDGVWRREFLAVNLANERESSLRSTLMPVSERIDAGTDSVTGEARRELWPWMLLAGLVVLTIEWVISVLRLGA